MGKMLIKLSKIEDIKEFVYKTTQYESDIDVICGKYVVDGKSIMGMFSLDLSRTLELTINPKNELELERFMNEFGKYKVNE